ncbi:hypothetical protein E8E14_003661 [Neopestalotiopsis sp. 37M]|nr:hypothetical protein E8E14_003661 [Neopestalotiopsis sp. 37M]
MGFECSENKDIRATKFKSTTADGAAIGTIGDRLSEEKERLFECRDCELALSWFRRCEGYVARLKLVMKSETSEAVHGIEELEDQIQDMKDDILRAVSDSLHCPSPQVREVAFSVVSSVMSPRPTGYVEYDTFESEEVLRALLKSAEESDRIDIELSVRERLICAMLKKLDPNQMTDVIRDYLRACERYMECIRNVELHPILRPGEHDFPFNGDIRILMLLIRYSSEISFQTKDVFRCDPLASAILIAEQTDIEQLIQNMDKARFLDLAKGDVANEYNHTILHSAAARGIMSVFDKVKTLDRGDIISMIDSQDLGSRTPLMLAASQGNCDVVKTLLDLGANPDAADDTWQNVLHHAVKNGHKEVTRVLTSRNPQQESLHTAANKDGLTALGVAIEAGHLDIVKLFPPEWSWTVVDPDGYSPLMRAVAEGHVQVVEWLLDERGVGDIDGVDSEGRTPLLTAVQARELDVVKFLLSRGADASIEDPLGGTPCRWARTYGRLDIVSVLEAYLALAADQ